jgi:hypothetical protein
VKNGPDDFFKSASNSDSLRGKVVFEKAMNALTGCDSLAVSHEARTAQQHGHTQPLRPICTAQLLSAYPRTPRSQFQ